MKKLTIGLALAVLAMVSSAQAGECCEKAQTVTAKKGKTTVSTKATASCSSEQTACGSKKSVVKASHTVKGATLLALR